MAEQGKFWTEMETKFLIDTWSNESIQKLLRGKKRNDAVYTQIVEMLAKRGYIRNTQQCRAKIKALKNSHI